MDCPQCGKTIKIHRNPIPTVDIIIEMDGGIVLIERKNPPHGWALPGGFVDYGETLEDAAMREALEETGLIVRLKGQMHTYSNPERDPRHHTISTVFIGHGDGTLKAGDDARKAAIFAKDKMPALAFDHSEILYDYFNRD